MFADDKELEEKEKIYSFDFYNTQIPTIQTGVAINNNLLLTFTGISLIGIILGIIILKRVF